MENSDIISNDYIACLISGMSVSERVASGQSKQSGPSDDREFSNVIGNRVNPQHREGGAVIFGAGENKCYRHQQMHMLLARGSVETLSFVNHFGCYLWPFRQPVVNDHHAAEQSGTRTRHFTEATRTAVTTTLRSACYHHRIRLSTV
jgi:hypothetical protein